MMQAFINGEYALPATLIPLQPYANDVQAALRLIAPAPMITALCLGETQITFYNDACASLIGEYHPKCMGQPLAQCWPDMHAQIGFALDKVMRSGAAMTVKDLKLSLPHDSASTARYADFALSPLLARDGTRLGVMCVISPTTPFILQSQALRESESRMRAIVSAATSGICTFTSNGEILGANDRFANMLGRPLAQIEGLNLNSLISPEDQSRFQSAAPIDGVPIHHEIRYLRGDGETIWVSQAVGEIEGLEGVACLIAYDISQKRRDEARLRDLAAIIEGSHDAIIAVDRELKITSINQGAAALFGFAQDEVYGKPVKLLFTADNSAEELEKLLAVLRGEAISGYETFRMCRDHRSLPVSVTLSPIFDEDGMISGASMIARDISARIDANRLQQVLLREMKHRVKNILASVLVIARQTFAQVKIPETATFNERVFALARAQDLLTREARDVAELAQLLQELTAPFPAEKFTFGGPEVMMSADTVRSLTLAFHELTTNTMKYGALSVPNGKVEITWALHPQSDAPPLLELTWVEKDGPPVTPPKGRGFGTTLIRDVLAAELRGKVTLDYPPEGLRFTAIFPSDLHI